MKSYTLLVVEDMTSVREQTIRYLYQSQTPFTILQAGNGKAACEIAETVLPDLILMDWHMPEMDGIEAVKYLHHQTETREIPIIITTSLEGSENLKTALDAGAVDYIRKPIDKVELLARVDSVLKTQSAFLKIKEQNQILARQKATLNQQKEEITTQANNLQEINRLLVEKNEQINQQKDEIMRAEGKFRLLFTCSTEAHLLVGSAGIIDCNDATLRQLRCRNKTDLLHKDPFSFSPEYQEDGMLSQKKARQIFQQMTEDGYHRFEWLFHDVNDRQFPAEVTLTPVDYNDQQAVLMVWHDLSEQKKAENILREQKEINEKKNKDITDSINYASRIQSAILPDLRDDILRLLPEAFVFYQPKAIVSGDFYWIDKINDKTILAVGDCTGHGVPGALMSMFAIAVLNQVIHTNNKLQADLILNQFHLEIRQAFKQNKGDNYDTIDLALCLIDQEKQVLEFAGARSALVYFQNGQLSEVKGDTHSIGGRQIDPHRHFTRHNLSIATETTIYLFSDGYKDQLGGKHGFKFMARRFYDLLKEIHMEAMPQQQKILDFTLQQWMTEEDQVDDILIIGCRL